MNTMPLFACVRANPIESIAYLQGQEAHAKRTSPTAEVRLGAEPGAALAWSILEDRPKDYLAAFKEHKRQTGGNERPSAALGIHLLVSVSPSFVEETGSGHDPGNRRNQRLFDEVLAWARRDFGGIFAARLDLDEQGHSVVDIFAAPVFEKKPRTGKRMKGGPPARHISIRKALEMASAKTGECRSYSALQTLWSKHANTHLDARIQRGKPQTSTGRKHLSVPEFRAMKVEIETDLRHAQGMKQTAATTAAAAMEWHDKLNQRELEIEEREAKVKRQAQRIAEAEMVSHSLLQSNIAELEVARIKVRKRETKLETQEMALKADRAQFNDHEWKLVQREGDLATRLAQDEDLLRRRKREMKTQAEDLERQSKALDRLRRQREEQALQEAAQLAHRMSALQAEEDRLAGLATGMADAFQKIGQVQQLLRRSPELAKKFPSLLPAVDTAGEARQTTRASLVRRKSTPNDLDPT